MSISLNPAIHKTLSPSDISSKAVIKKTPEGAADAVKVQFADILQQGCAVPEQEVVTNDEKQFFTKLFPEATSAIQSYAGYTPGGAKKPVALGTIIDIKG